MLKICVYFCIFVYVGQRFLLIGKFKITAHTNQAEESSPDQTPVTYEEKKDN